MKKEQEQKFPSSANLFKFCRRVLDHKYGGVRVIDQDIGQILGFDPADCSHWKKGKKNIKSIQAIKEIAKHLEVDERLIVDIASGELNDFDAYNEYCGYNPNIINDSMIEKAKKDFHRKNAHTWNEKLENDFDTYFKVNFELIQKSVDQIHEHISFKEAPLFLKEIADSYPEIKLRIEPIPNLSDNKNFESGSTHFFWEGNQFIISYNKENELKPYTRFSMAKSLSVFFLPERKNPVKELLPLSRKLIELESYIFASRLLVPKHMLLDEMKQIDISKDIISQLAETFWVSRSLINIRLKDALNQTAHLEGFKI